MRLLILLLGLSAALAIALGILLTRDDRQPDFRGSHPPAALGLPNFSLKDNEGRMVRSGELQGKVVAVTFLDAQCKDACPIAAAQIASSIRLLGKDATGVEALGISVDPVRDTPKRIDTFLRRFKAKSEIRYLNGSPADLLPLWRAFSVRASYQTDGNIHSAPVYVYDKSSRLRSSFQPGVDLTAINLAHDLREAMRVS
jgi:protein SCO1